MAPKWGFFFVLLLTQAGALYLFTRGFLLTRREIAATSTCDTIPDLSTKSGGGCWMEPRFKRLVLIVIDAWRHDFATWDEEFENLSIDDQELDPKRFYTNHMHSIHDILADQPEHGFMIKFLSDAPTVTMQRLKGLTTGSFPTFIDVGANFDSDEISEDNLLDQLVKNKKVTVFMGDDTWTMLFPNRFTRSYDYPSFNVKDIHSVDNGVLAHLMPEVSGQRGYWDVLIAHFLGVDHVGHTYGPDHPAMHTKLQQMDDTLRDVMDALDNDTILFVIGDHGMTSDGNHGGSDKQEIETALFAYSKRPLDIIRDGEISMVGFQETTGVPQIAFPPTLSLLLGIPIPFGSLGHVIPDLFLFGDVADCPAVEYKRLAMALSLNAGQVHRYLLEYGGLDTNKVAKLITRAERTSLGLEQVMQMSPSHCTAAKEYRRISLEFLAFLRDSSHLCHEAWTQFNTFDMLWGIFVGVLALIIAPLALFSQKGKNIRWMHCIGAIIVSLVIPEWIIPRVASVIVVILLFVGWSVEIHWTSFVQPPLIAALIAISLHFMSLFSNSFIEAEGSVTRFLCSSMVVVIALLSGKRKILLPALVSVIAARIGSESKIGVDVQVACRDGGNPILETFAPLIVLVWFGQKWTNQKVMRVIWIISMSLLGIHWTFQCAGNLQYPYILPRSIFVFGFLGMIYAVYSRRFRCLFMSSMVIILLILGPMSPRTAVLLGVQCWGFLQVIDQSKMSNKIAINIVMGLWWSLWSQQAFFDTGHRAKISFLHVSAAFVLSNEYSFILNGALMVLNTFGGYIAAIMAAPAVFEPTDVFFGSILWRHGGQAIFTSMFVYFARRHLMVHAIFAPKYSFDVVSGGIVAVVTLCMLWMR